MLTSSPLVPHSSLVVGSCPDVDMQGTQLPCHQALHHWGRLHSWLLHLFSSFSQIDIHVHISGIPFGDPMFIMYELVLDLWDINISIMTHAAQVRNTMTGKSFQWLHIVIPGHLTLVWHVMECFQCSLCYRCCWLFHCACPPAMP